MARGKTKTTIKDKGYKFIVKQIKKGKGAYCEVGFHSDSPKYPDGTDLADVAFYNEFGTNRIPARPFLRPMVSEKKKYFQKLFKELFGKIVKRKETMEHALETVAWQVGAATQNKINKVFSPPNAPSTIARKGHSKPLVDTGFMRAHVGWNVTLKGKSSKVKYDPQKMGHK